jgi:hypothetical protein
MRRSNPTKISSHAPFTSISPTSTPSACLPFDSRHLYNKSDWEFEAAAVSTPKVRKQILDAVALWVNETDIDRPITDLYFTDIRPDDRRGYFPGIYFKVRSVVGGNFSFLALG